MPPEFSLRVSFRIAAGTKCLEYGDPSLWGRKAPEIRRLTRQARRAARTTAVRPDAAAPNFCRSYGVDVLAELMSIGRRLSNRLGKERFMSLFSIKPFDSLTEDGADSRAGGLHRALGVFSLVGLGIGAIIGAGLFSLTGIAAAENAGPAVVLSFLIAALGCAFAGMCYSELAAMIPVSGSAYTYAQATLGELVAWVIGWTLVLEYAIGAATVSVSWSSYVVDLLQSFGLALPLHIHLGDAIALGGLAI